MSSSLIGLVPQTAEHKELTEHSLPSDNPLDQKFIESLLAQLENDCDLRLLLERWPRLSEELRQAIVRMVG